MPWRHLHGLNSCMEDYLRCECETSAEHTTVKTDTVALYTDKGIYGRVVDAEDVEAWTNVHASTAKLFGLGIIPGDTLAL